MTQKVSIIIATHSRPHLLPRAVQSAFDAGTDVEVVVVDDASTDETADVCKKLDGIKYVRVDRNQHTAGARNIGITAASAPYLGFLDDDDWRLPGSLDKQVEILDERPEVGIVYGQFLSASQDGTLTEDDPAPQLLPEGDVFWEMMKGVIFGCLTAVFRKECIERVGLLDPNYSGIDDWDIWLRIAELYPVAALEEPVAVWRKAAQGSGQGSSNMTKLHSLAAKAYREKWLRLPRAVNDLGDNLDVFQSSILRSMSERIIHDMAYETEGDTERIRKVCAALRCYPRRAAEFSFYKMIAKNFILDTKRQK